MLLGVMALVLASLFTGAAAYISLVEHPVRFRLDDLNALAQWKPSYERALPIQAGLAMLGGCAGLVVWYLSGNWQWLVGGITLLANWPFSIWGILPTNKILKSVQANEAGPVSRTLLIRWGRLHNVRTILGAVAMLLFACGLLTP